MHDLETARLRLVAHSPADVLAAMSGDAPAAADGAGDGVREMMTSDDVSPVWLARLRAAPRDVADPWVCGFGVVRRTDGASVGSAGFKGPPDEAGVAEIAYGMAEAHRGQGYATEVVTALITFARADARVRVIRAHTLPAANASARVLTKCGFRRVGEVIDPEDGLVWRWEL